jgi:hypothetical protein
MRRAAASGFEVRTSIFPLAMFSGFCSAKQILG